MNHESTIVSSDFSDLDHMLENAFPEETPGAAALVQKQGEILLRKGYGCANLEWGLPITPDTVFRIGSVTKQFTAVAILMLKEQNKLVLSDPIEKFIPSYPTHGHTITIEHLLTHTSGIKSYTNMKEWLPAWGKNFTLDELVDFFKFQPMEFSPGTRWAYNNSAYILLTAIIEKVSGTTFDSFLQEHIFEPLGMKQTCLELPGKIIPRRASGYSFGPKGWAVADYISMTQPLGAGGMVSTVDDLAVWDTALYEGKILPVAAFEKAHTSFRLLDGSQTDYGYGWGVDTYQGQTVLHHGGGIHGFVCYVARMPGTRTFAVVLTNRDNPAKDPEELCFRAILQANGLTFPEPVGVETTVSELAKFEGVYEIQPELVVTFAVKEGVLQAVWPGQEQGDVMLVTSPAQLVDPKHPLRRVQFTLGESGAATGFEVINQYGRISFKASRKEN
jgi:D-alanyl-D-alanine carboxypeptidase